MNRALDPRLLLADAVHAPASDHEIVLYFYPSPGLWWNSPAALTITSARNDLLKLPRSIGHVSVRVRSKGDPAKGRPDIHFHTGMTKVNPGEGRVKVLQEGYGLGILFYDFKGKLETAGELEPEILARARKGTLSYFRVAVNREACERLAAYLGEYVERACDTHYGMPHRPLYAEGGGCSAFAASMLETAGVLRPEFETRWTRRYRMPLALIGGPRAGGRKIGIPTMMTRGWKWATENEPHEPLFAWDPDLMHEWLVETYVGADAREGGEFKREIWERARGISYAPQSLRVPTGGFFKGEPDFSRMS